MCTRKFAIRLEEKYPYEIEEAANFQFPHSNKLVSNQDNARCRPDGYHQIKYRFEILIAFMKDLKKCRFLVFTLDFRTHVEKNSI